MTNVAKPRAFKGFREACSFINASVTGIIQKLIDRDQAVSCVPIFKTWAKIRQ
jgi:hypothetical protein